MTNCYELSWWKTVRSFSVYFNIALKNQNFWSTSDFLRMYNPAIKLQFSYGFYFALANDAISSSFF